MRARPGMTTREILLLVGVLPLSLILASVYLASLKPHRYRSMNQTKLANIAKAYLNFSNSGGGGRSIKHGSWSASNPDLASSIVEYAAVLAYTVDFNDAEQWYIDADVANEEAMYPHSVTMLVDRKTVISPLFAKESAKTGYVSWAAYAPVPTDLGGATPLVWTRGLRRDGTWDAAKGVYGAEGGHIAFGDGHVEWHENTRDVSGGFVSRRTPGALTADWTEAVSADGEVHELKSSY